MTTQDHEALETVAAAAIEIIRELRGELGLTRGDSLLAAVRQLQGDCLVAKGMHVARDVLDESRQKRAEQLYSTHVGRLRHTLRVILERLPVGTQELRDLARHALEETE